MVIPVFDFVRLYAHPKLYRAWHICRRPNSYEFQLAQWVEVLFRTRLRAPCGAGARKEVLSLLAVQGRRAEVFTSRRVAQRR